MKKFIIPALSSLLSLSAFAETQMVIHTKSENKSIPVNEQTELTLSSGNLNVNGPNGNTCNSDLTTLANVQISEMDSITFEDPISENYVQIIYQCDKAKIINPYAGKGIDITTEKANVVVTSTTEDKNIKFYISGSSENGSLTITPSKKFNLILDNLTLKTNSDQPAIKILEDKACYITLIGNNTLSGSSQGEDYKAVLWSNTQVIFDDEVDENGDPIVGGKKGDGSIEINSEGTESTHGIYSTDYVRINNGNININVNGDGINTKDYFEINKGNLTIMSKSDGIDCNDQIYIKGGTVYITSDANDAKGLKCDSIISITGGNSTITMSGNGSKAIKNEFENIEISDAKLNIVNTGDLFIENSERSYTTGIKTEKNVNITNSEVSILCSPNATGSKGINATEGISIKGNSVVYIYINGQKDNEAESGGKVVGLKTDNLLEIDNSATVTIEMPTSEEKGVKYVDAYDIYGSYEEK